MSIHALTKNLGNNIRAKRLLANMTQLDLAHAIGYAGPDAGAYISRVESGQQEPRLDTIQRIAEALGTTLEKLIGSKSKLSKKK